MIELTGGNVDSRIIGNKAFSLNELLSLQIPIPPTAVVPIDVPNVDIAALRAWLIQITNSSDRWRLAIRSSSAIEDTATESKAGHFLSLLGDFSIESIPQAVERVRRSGPDMAVIIQPLVDAVVAGVFFSCDPLTYSRERSELVWTQGLADRLVSGEDPGQRVALLADGTVAEGSWPAGAAALQQLVQHARRVEAEFAGPVDIEWAVDQNDGLRIVQARRIVLPRAHHVSLDSDVNFRGLPAVVQQHPKIRLRRTAFQSGITMAPAIVEWWSNGRCDTSESDLAAIKKSAGASVVLLHPERVERQIVREFSPVVGSDVNFFAKTCRRYAIRRYPRTTGLAEAKASVLEAGLAVSWVSVAIAQAVWDAHATGIIQRTDEGYIIEVALGHFVPKGVVPTSTIILSKEKRVVSAVWREQPTCYRFIDGHVLTETPPKQQLRFDDATLFDIASTLDPLFDRYDAPVLEFGMIGSPQQYKVYLIDIAEGNGPGSELSAALVSSGVLSTGSCRGRIHRVNLSAVGALDTHFHDRPDGAALDGDGIVIVAERASVDLLPFVGAPGIVGFVFERGSVLAHLAVVLREKGVPAIALEDKELFEALPEECTVMLNASEPSLPQRDRIKVV